MAIAQLVISTLGLLWFIFGSGGLNITHENNQTQSQQNQQTNRWIYRSTDNHYNYYSDYSGVYWCRVDLFTGEVSYKR